MFQEWSQPTRGPSGWLIASRDDRCLSCDVCRLSVWHFSRESVCECVMCVFERLSFETCTSLHGGRARGGGRHTAASGPSPQPPVTTQNHRKLSVAGAMRISLTLTFKRGGNVAKALKGAKAQGVGARVAGWLALESGAGGWLGRVQIFNSHLKIYIATASGDWSVPVRTVTLSQSHYINFKLSHRFQHRLTPCR